ncbi:DUF4411 family protein [Asticcacaulis endophyticus]|uniref:DUF4411 family protein n=1 Tax=Asticcacaulis endophyticus TaxID=1395890 RepID=A0A918QGW6_9CAUL|nr:hypothetical protein GCM10011273_35130 [Asticcacaulis endophyticus]
MIYLLDANVLMTAHDNYYPLDTVPQFWDWLIATGREGHKKYHTKYMVKSPPALMNWALGQNKNMSARLSNWLRA